MHWPFDQPRDAAWITGQSVIGGRPVLVATRYAGDHSRAFMDGLPVDMATARVVAMATVVDRRPALVEIASLPPCWSATRPGVGTPWTLQKDASNSV